MKSEISALVDNELAPESIDRTLDEMKRNAELYASWRVYHVIGDVLRRAPAVSPDFSGRIMARLSTEPVVLAPAAMADSPQSRIRIALPLAAAAMGMAAVAWVALSLNPPESGSLAAAKPAKVQVQPVAAPAAAPPQGAIKEYLVAHQAYSSGNRIQGVAPAIRTVSEIRQGDRR